MKIFIGMALLIGMASTSSVALAAEHGRISSADQKFMVKAAADNMAEVQLGQLAQMQGTTQDVKDFGTRMTQDHNVAYDELKALAQRKEVSLPGEMPRKDQELLNKLKTLSGPSFDKMYIDHMVREHKKDVAEFEKEKNVVTDSDLKRWITKTLPVLKSHLHWAKEIAMKLQEKQ